MQKTNLTQAWFVVLIAALYFFYIFVQIMIFNAIGHDLLVQLKMGSTGLGFLSSVYFWGNVAFLFPAGLLLDRFSTRKILLLIMLVTVVCTFVFAFITTFNQALICRLLIGLAGAFGLLIPLRLAVRWFPPAKMALVSGLIITIGFFGAMVSQAPMTILTNYVGWRHAVLWDAAGGVVIWLLMFSVVRDFPAGMTREMSHEQATSLSFLWQSIKKVITNWQNWLFGIYTCLLNLPMLVFGAAFGIRYLEQAQHLTEEHAAFIMVILFVGSMIGLPVIGWASDKLKARKPLMIICALISIALILTEMYVPGLNYFAIVVIFLALGFFTSAQVITYPVISESNDVTVTATALALASSIIQFGGVFSLPLFGWLLDLNWHGGHKYGVPWHSVADYRMALWIFPVCFAIGLIAVLFGKETYCKRIA
jgi:predicted MFS family arabinose efflux permease